MYKARIKILVHELGAEVFTAMVEEEWSHIRDGAIDLPAAEIERIKAYFAPPAYERLDPVVPAFAAKRLEAPDFNQWVRTNIFAHKQPGYAHRQHLAETRRRRAGATRRPRRWTSSPSWLTPTAWARSG